MPALIALALVFAALVQQAEPPARPLPERLRPVRRPPRDDTFFNTGPLLYKGVELHAGWMQASGLEMDVPDGIETRSQGFGNPFVVTLEYDQMDVEAVEVGATFDLGLFRFTLDGFKGRWEGTATLTADDGVNPPTSTPESLDGVFYGVRGGMYWPAMRLRLGGFEAALGPDFTVAWYHQNLDSVPGSPLPLSDKVSEIVGGLGPRLSIRFLSERFDFTLEAEVPYLFGAARGWGTDYSAGFGLRF